MPRPRRNPDARWFEPSSSHWREERTNTVVLSVAASERSDRIAAEARPGRAHGGAVCSSPGRQPPQKKDADAKKAGGKNTPWAGDLDGE